MRRILFSVFIAIILTTWASPAAFAEDYQSQFRRQVAAYNTMVKAHQASEDGRFNEAKRLYEVAASYDPSDYSASIHANIAFLLQKMGQPEGSIIEGKKALQFDPNDTNTMYILGFAYADMSKFDEAIAWLRRYASLEKDPQSRKSALKCIDGFTEDKALCDDPNNKSGDYYSLEEQIVRWAKHRMPLKVAILPGTGVYGYKPSFPNLVKNALDTWCEASGKRIDYKIVSDKSAADIKVDWTKDPLEISSDHANTQPCGLTQRYEDDYHGNIRAAFVHIRTVNPFHPEEVVLEAECAHTITHEIGHALGLKHSKKITDVMYFRSSKQQSGPPTSRDRATLARMYSDYPVLAFVPKASTTGGPVTYAPPPSFLPPAAPDNTKLAPPVFLPPPIDSDKESVAPPIFTPPPIKMGSQPPKKSVSEKKPESAKKSQPVKPETTKKTVAPPVFIPPPLR